MSRSHHITKQKALENMRLYGDMDAIKYWSEKHDVKDRLSHYRRLVKNGSYFYINYPPYNKVLLSTIRKIKLKRDDS